VLALTSLSEFAGRYPPKLSGGMRQRVCISRAFTTRLQALLMDELCGLLGTENGK